MANHEDLVALVRILGDLTQRLTVLEERATNLDDNQREMRAILDQILLAISSVKEHIDREQLANTMVLAERENAELRQEKARASLLESLRKISNSTTAKIIAGSVAAIVAAWLNSYAQEHFGISLPLMPVSNPAHLAPEAGE